MPSRNYCDVCDSLIEDDAQQYSISIGRTNTVYNRPAPGDILHLDEYVSRTVEYSMVCIACATKVRIKLYEMKGGK